MDGMQWVGSGPRHDIGASRGGRMVGWGCLEVGRALRARRSCNPRGGRFGEPSLPRPFFRGGHDVVLPLPLATIRRPRQLGRDAVSTLPRVKRMRCHRIPTCHPSSVLYHLILKGPRLCRFRLELHLFLDLGGRYVATARTRPVGSHLPYIMFVGKGGCRGCRTPQGTVNMKKNSAKSKRGREEGRFAPRYP